MWGRVLLRAWGHFASPRERNRRVCWWPVLSRLRLQRGKKSRGPQLYVLHCNGYTHATSPQFAAVSCAVSPNRRPHLQHFLALPCSFCSPSLVWFWPTGGGIPTTCGWNNGVHVPPRNILPGGILFPLGVPPGKVQPFGGNGGLRGLLARLCLPGEHDVSRGVSGLSLLSAWFRYWHYLSHRHFWLESKCETRAKRKRKYPRIHGLNERQWRNLT